jgi:bacterioferritin (cytochrome b1)
MTVEEAIKTALEYEVKVRDSYLNAIDSIKDETGQHVFRVLGGEEQGHIDYLESRLTEWRKTGKISPEKLKTVVPSRRDIDAGVRKLEGHLAKRDYGTEREMLQKALALEKETSDFYKKMVDELNDDESKLFARFLEIEEGHQAIVQAEIDYLSRSGTFFDFQEFGQEY